MSTASFEKNFQHSLTCEKVTLIGLIGDVAGGKTTVARRLAERGAGWIDADRMAHWCLRLPSVRHAIERQFGQEVLHSNGFVDRKKLAAEVFGADAISGTKLKCLEQIVHPPTRLLAQRRLERFVRRGLTIVIMDAPLLLEAGWDVLCDEVWCVQAPWLRRVQWAASRGWSQDELRARQDRQMTTYEKSLKSTVIVENFADRATLIKQVDQIFEQRLFGR